MRRLPNPTSLTAEQREELRAMHAGSFMTRHAVLADGSSVYVSNAGVRPQAMAFKGKALRPAFNYLFRDHARRDSHVAEWMAERSKEAETKKAPRPKHSLQIGAILHCSWGWEQTNCDFYEVVAVRGTFVELRELDTERTSTGDMSGTATPIPGKFVGPVLRKRPDGSNHVRITSFSGAWPWDGTPKRWTSYA